MLMVSGHVLYGCMVALGHGLWRGGDGASMPHPLPLVSVPGRWFWVPVMRNPEMLRTSCEDLKRALYNEEQGEKDRFRGRERRE